MSSSGPPRSERTALSLGVFEGALQRLGNETQRGTTKTVLRRLVGFLLFIGTASLPYSPKITNRGALTLHSLTYRSDFVFLAAVILASANWAVSAWPWRRPSLTRTEVIAATSMAFYVGSCLFATLLALVTYGLWFDLVGFAAMAKTLLGASLFLVMYFSTKNNAPLYGVFVWALILPPLLPVALTLMFQFLRPEHQHLVTQFRLVSSGDRLQELTSNPYQASFGLVTALAFLCPIAFQQAYRARWLYFTAALVCIEVAVVGVLWAQVRVAMLASTFVLLGGAAVMLRYVRASTAHYAAAASIAVVVIASALSILPKDAANALATRIAPGPRSQTATASAVVASDANLTRNSIRSGYGRLPIWKYYVGVARRNLLGIGFNYDQRFFYFFINAYGEHIGAHNNLLLTWMFGGVVAVLSLMVLWWQLFRSAVIGLRCEKDVCAMVLYLGAAVALAGIWLMSVAVGNLIGEPFTYSILMAMVLAGPPRLGS